jgi:hypothetical protein
MEGAHENKNMDAAITASGLLTFVKFIYTSI